MANKIRYVTSDGRIEYAEALLIKPIDVLGEKGFVGDFDISYPYYKYEQL